MNREYRIVFGGIMIAFTFYVASYWSIRQANTRLHIECDGCPVEGREEVTFPGDGVYLVYGPLYQLDKLTSPSSSSFYVLRQD